MNFEEEVEKFKREQCKDCKNKSTQLCSIVTNINGKQQCVYRETNMNNEKKIRDFLKKWNLMK